MGLAYHLRSGDRHDERWPSSGAVRGPLIYCRDDPFLYRSRHGIRARAGRPVDLPRRQVRSGRGLSVAAETRSRPALRVEHYPDCLIAPGFVDTHVHYSADRHHRRPTAKGLLGWLDEYTFPAEQELADESKRAGDGNLVFCDELLRNGMTDRSGLLCASIRNRSMRCSPKRRSATCGSSPARC